MLFWTILNEADVFNRDPVEKPKEYREVAMDGAILIVEVLPDGRGKVERLISLRSNDYFNLKWQPGTIMNLR